MQPCRPMRSSLMLLFAAAVSFATLAVFAQTGTSPVGTPAGPSIPPVTSPNPGTPASQRPTDLPIPGPGGGPGGTAGMGGTGGIGDGPLDIPGAPMGPL